MARGLAMVLGLSLLAGAAGAQQAVDAFDLPGWSGAAYLDRTGAFDHCAVTSAVGGVTLSFRLDKAQNFRIEIGAEDWRLKPGGDYITKLVIDAREPLQTIASAGPDNRLAIDFGPDDDFMKALRNGLFLRVLAEHIGLSFSLTGSAAALQRLSSCVVEHGGAAKASG